MDSYCDQELYNSIIGQEDGYVPSFMPEDHFGDYIILNIDLETGQILNWKKPSEEDLQKWIDGLQEE